MISTHQPENMGSEIEAEERKRNKAYDPVQRWNQIQATIAWAEANMPEDQRRNRPRVPAWQTPEQI